MTGVKTDGMTKTIEEVVQEQAVKCRIYVEQAHRLAEEKKIPLQEALEKLLRVRFTKAVLEKSVASAAVAAYTDSMERIMMVAKGALSAATPADILNRLDGLVMGLKCTRDEEAKKA